MSSWFHRNKAPRAEKKSVVLGTSDALGKFLQIGAGSAATPSAALNLYESCSAVSIPVNKIADPLAVMEPVLRIGDKVVRDHEVLRLLKAPSPRHTRELFFQCVVKDFLITGENFVVALGNVDRPPLQLIPISPKNLSPVRSFSDVPASWIVSGNTLNGDYYATPNVDAPRVRYLDGALRELWQTRNYSTRDNSLLRGQSPLVSASKEARQHFLGTMHNVSLLENGGRISLVFHFSEDMEDDDFEETKKRILQRFGGAAEAGKISVSAGGHLQVEELGKNPRDLDFGTLQQVAARAVAMVYNIPIPIITDSRQTLSNYQIAVLALLDDAILPTAQWVLGGLSHFLLPRYGLDPRDARIEIDRDSVTALVMRRNEELVKRAKIGVETDDELRAYLGREPIEGGDVLRKPATLVPIGTDLFTDDNAPDRREPALGGTAG